MKKILLLVLLGLSVACTSAATPQSLISESTQLNGQSRTGTGNTYAHVIDGQTAYVSFMKGGITKITNINGTQTASTLFTQAYWGMMSGVSATGLTVFNGLGISGDYLLWTDATTDAVWKADKVTGVISSVVNNAAIKAYTGGATASSHSSFTLAPNGGLTFYEGVSKQFLNADMSGNLTTVKSGLSGSLTGCGLTYDTAGNLYYSDNDTDVIYRVTPGGAIETVLSSASIYAASGQVSAYVNDIFYAKDGWMFFYESTDKSIMSFNVANPAATLSVFYDMAALASNYNRAVTFGLYNDGTTDYLTYNAYLGDLMYAPIPEPATLSLLLLGGLGLVRRNKR